MARLLLLLDRQTWLRRKALRMFAENPKLFTRMISSHANHPKPAPIRAERNVRSRMAGLAGVSVANRIMPGSARVSRSTAELQNAWRRAAILFALACCGMLAFAPTAPAQAFTAKLDPAQTKIAFTLGTTLHTVHGTFQLKSGEVHFDAATGKASGTIVMDARSADTDNKSRDKKMHQEILESQKYPEIVFTPQQVRGSFDPQKASQVDITGTFRIHGQDHDFTMTIAVATSHRRVSCSATRTSRFPT